jgi:hypothetical protein
MSSQSYVVLPGQDDTRLLWSLDQWLPGRDQIASAVQLRIHEVIGATGDERENEALPTTTSMRQGIGLILVTGLLAGVLPFLVNWIVAAGAGTALPLAQLARQLAARNERWSTNPPFGLDIWIETASTVAGLDPRLPGWLAALLSALGEWINWPLRWLTIWLVYGLVVLLVSRLWGATTTLQRFYAATSYAVAPLLLTALTPIPCLGALAGLVAGIWAGVVYVHAVQTVTGLSPGHAALSALLPAALFLSVGILMVGAALITMIGLVL